MELEGTGPALAIFGPEGTVLGVSARFLRLAGVTALPAGVRAEALLSQLGFEPVGEGPFHFRRAGFLLRQRIEHLGGGLSVLTLEERVEDEAQLRLRFLSIASHDLRGPIANVRGYASFLLDLRSDLDEKARRSLETILRNADKALGLLREVFDSGQAEYQPLELFQERRALLPLVNRALEEARTEATNRGVTLNVQLPESLPEMAMDEDALSHAVSAFLLHGVSRTGTGQAVDISAGVKDGTLHLSVGDPGPRLSDEDALHAFDRDVRTAQEGKLSFGFRLALARAEVESHGGTVGIERLPERTVFFLSLPLV